MPSFQLEVQQNGAVQSRSFMRAPILIGRERNVDLVLDHPTVSRQHAQILHDPQRGYFLKVLSSSGLTAVDGQQVGGEVPLYQNSMINLGQVTIAFRAQDAMPRPGQPGGGFGASPGFGAAPGFGQPAAPAPQQSGGFGAAPGFGAAAGFGQPAAPAPQQSGGFGAAPGFGQPAAPQAPAGPPSGSFGAPSFNQGGGLPGATPTPAAPTPFGSGFKDSSNHAASEHKASNVWDEIAQSAEEIEDDGQESLRDDQYFKRMEAAEQKGKEQLQSKFNPLTIVGAVLIVGLMVFILLPTGGGGSGASGNVASDGEESEDLVINVVCEGNDCVELATTSYQIAREKFEKREVKMSNTFESYKSALEAQAYLDSGKVSDKSAFSELDTIISTTRSELDARFNEQRRNYIYHKQKKAYSEMIDTLEIINSYFPDKSTKEAQWAAEKERAMRKAGVYKP